MVGKVKSLAGPRNRRQAIDLFGKSTAPTGKLDQGFDRLRS
jgi:hypothetical protein